MSTMPISAFQPPKLAATTSKGSVQFNKDGVSLDGSSDFTFDVVSRTLDVPNLAINGVTPDVLNSVSTLTGTEGLTELFMGAQSSLSVPLTIPFNFFFLFTNYGNGDNGGVTIGSNGFLEFGSGGTTNINNPSSIDPAVIGKALCFGTSSNGTFNSVHAGLVGANYVVRVVVDYESVITITFTPTYALHFSFINYYRMYEKTGLWGACDGFVLSDAINYQHSDFTVYNVNGRLDGFSPTSEIWDSNGAFLNTPPKYYNQSTNTLHIPHLTVGLLDVTKSGEHLGEGATFPQLNNIYVASGSTFYKTEVSLPKYAGAVLQANSGYSTSLQDYPPNNFTSNTTTFFVRATPANTDLALVQEAPDVVNILYLVDFTSITGTNTLSVFISQNRVHGDTIWRAASAGETISLIYPTVGDIPLDKSIGSLAIVADGVNPPLLYIKSSVEWDLLQMVDTVNGVTVAIAPDGTNINTPDIGALTYSTYMINDMDTSPVGMYTYTDNLGWIRQGGDAGSGVIIDPSGNFILAPTIKSYGTVNFTYPGVVSPSEGAGVWYPHVNNLTIESFYAYARVAGTDDTEIAIKDYQGLVLGSVVILANDTLSAKLSLNNYTLPDSWFISMAVLNGTTAQDIGVTVVYSQPLGGI